MTIFQDLGRNDAAVGDEVAVFDAFDSIDNLPERTPSNYQARIDMLQDRTANGAYDTARENIAGKNKPRKRTRFDHLADADIAFTTALTEWNLQDRLDALRVVGGNLADPIAQGYFNELAAAPIAALTAFLALQQNYAVLDANTSTAENRLAALGNADGQGPLAQSIEQAKNGLSPIAQRYFDELMTEERDSIAAGIAFEALKEANRVLDPNKDAATRLAALGGADGTGAQNQAIEDARQQLNPNTQLYFNWSINNLRKQVVAEIAFLALKEANGILDANAHTAAQRLAALGGGVGGAAVDQAIIDARDNLVDVDTQNYFDELVAKETEALAHLLAKEAFEPLTINRNVLDAAAHTAAERLAALVDDQAGMWGGGLPVGGEVERVRNALGNNAIEDRFDELVADAIRKINQEINEELANAAFVTLTTNGGVLDVAPAEQFRLLGGIRGVDRDAAVQVAVDGLALSWDAQHHLEELLNQRLAEVANAGAEAAFATLTTNGGVLDVAPVEQVRVLGNGWEAPHAAIVDARETLGNYRAQDHFDELLEHARANARQAAEQDFKQAAEQAFAALEAQGGILSADVDVLQQFEALGRGHRYLFEGSISDARNGLPHDVARDRFDELVQRKLDSIAIPAVEAMFVQIEKEIENQIAAMQEGRFIHKFGALTGIYPLVQDLEQRGLAVMAGHLKGLVERKLEAMAQEVAADMINFLKTDDTFANMSPAEKLDAINSPNGQNELLRVREFLGKHDGTLAKFEQLLEGEKAAIEAEIARAQAAPAQQLRAKRFEQPAPVELTEEAGNAIAALDLDNEEDVAVKLQKIEDARAENQALVNEADEASRLAALAEKEAEIIAAAIVEGNLDDVQERFVDIDVPHQVAVVEQIVHAELSLAERLERLQNLRGVDAANQHVVQEGTAMVFAEAILEHKLAEGNIQEGLVALPAEQRQLVVEHIVDPAGSLAERYAAAAHALAAVSQAEGRPLQAELQGVQTLVISDTATAIVQGNATAAREVIQQMPQAQQQAVKNQVAKKSGW